MIDFLELKEPGASVAMLVQRVSRQKSKFGEDYVFLGNVEPNRQAQVSVPEKATERQLANVLKVDGADDLVHRFIVISRSDQPGPNGKLYWNITWADEDTFASIAPTPAASANGSRRVQAPADYGDELKNDPSGDGRPRATPQATPKASVPVTEDERDAAQEKRRAEMVRLRKIFHSLWASEALVQLEVAAELADEHPELPRLVIDGSSVNAATASQFIEFNKRNLL